MNPTEGVELRDGSVEGRLRKLAGLLLVLEDFVVADGVVQRETETDGVGGLELLLGDLESLQKQNLLARQNGEHKTDLAVEGSALLIVAKLRRRELRKVAEGGVA